MEGYPKSTSISEHLQKITKDVTLIRSEKLGQGTFGKVYKGFMHSIDDFIAIKFISFEKKDPAIQDNEREKVYRQIQSLQELMKYPHQNIMKYYGHHWTNEFENQVYLFLQLCREGPLQTKIERQLSQIQVLKIARQCISAMAHLNKRNIIHRDLKPANILLDQNHNSRLADFGLARKIQIEMTKHRGTPLYEAPQILHGKQYDARSDVWSFGVLLYEMLTGKPLFRNLYGRKDVLMQKQKQVKTLQILPSYFDQSWASYLQRCLQYDYMKRITFEDLNKCMQKDAENGYIDVRINAKYGEDNFTIKNRKFSIRMSLPWQEYDQIADFDRYIIYFKLKLDMYSKLKYQFEENKYNRLPMQYKGAIIKLSSAIYMKTLDEFILQIQSNRVKLPGKQQPIQIMCKSPEYQSVFYKIVSSFKESIASGREVAQTNYTKAKNFLKSLLKAAGFTTLSHESLKAVNFIQCIRKLFLTKSSQLDSSSTLKKHFRQLASLPPVYLNENEIMVLSDEDLKAYYELRILYYIDEMFAPEILYKKIEDFRLKKQKMKQASREEMLELLLTQKYNKNQL